jgi:hypothetical protein
MKRTVVFLLCLLLAVAGIGSAGQYGKCIFTAAHEAEARGQACCCTHQTGMHQACTCCAQASEADEVTCDCNIPTPILFVSAFQVAVSGPGGLRADLGDRVDVAGSFWSPHSITAGTSIVEYGPIEVILRTCSFCS